MARLSPEFRLALACSMWPPSDRRIEAIRAAASGPLDWLRFLRVAKRHQVVGLVHDGLRRALPVVPPEIAQEIAGQAAILIRENLGMAREALRLQRLFDEADLPVLFVKGAALSLLAFGDLGLRSAQDIDLLVANETLPAATALLLHAGYRQFDPPPEISDDQMRLVMSLRKDVGLVHLANGFRIELHWRPFLNQHAMPHTSIMSASRFVPLTGTSGLRTMSAGDLFAYLCMHGALHSWSRLKWLADINALISAFPDGSVEQFIRAAEVTGARRAATQALMLCRRLLGTPVPDRLLDPIAKSATARWLETSALNAMTCGQSDRQPQEEPFGTTRGSLSTFLLGGNWRYWLAELRIHLINETDVLTVPLPERLRFLYPLLRLPLWVHRHATKCRSNR
jgi:hypothetical protein